MSAGLRRVAVVGGGVAGLAAARRLCARGDLDVVVYEASDRPGGVIGTSVADGFMREHAANGFLTGASGGAAELAEELGLPVEPASPAARRRWVFRGGALRPIPSGPGDVFRAELVSWRGLLHALGEPFRPPRRSGPEETVADFARRRLGDEVLDALVAPFCTGVFAGDPEELSLRAAFPKLAALEAEGGLVRGMAGRAFRRAFGQEESAPRVKTRLAAPVGGMAALVAALAREIGPRLQLGRPAIAVEVEAGGRARAVRLADGQRHPCDAVVLAVPAPLAARLVSDASQPLAKLLDSIPYAAVAAVHLGYRRADLPPGDRFDGFGFLVARGEELRTLGAVFESVIWPSRAPDGHLLIRCILGGVRDPSALDLSDDDLVAQARRDLGRALGLEAQPVHRHVVRWPRAIAQYTLGHLDRVARAEELADPLGVVLAGASYHGVAVNACTADAARVAHRVAARLGLAIAALIGLASCSSGGKSSGAAGAPAASDAGGVAAPAPRPAEPAAPLPSNDGDEGRGEGGPSAASGSPGSVDIAVEWLSPPAELVTSSGRNPCGAQRRPPLSVSSLGGVEGAVVRLEGAAPLADPAKPGEGAAKPVELALRRCRLDPRALRASGTGASLAVTSFDEQRHDLALDVVAEGKGEAAALVRTPLVLVGQRVEIPLDRPGIVRVSSAADPASSSWVIVPGGDHVAVSDERGRVHFEGVPAGKYAVSVWHPPTGENRPPLTARASVEVVSGSGASATVSLAPARAAASR
jgi:protoporphyrinogen/coproporphyrinogen III oxidase